MVRPPPCYTLFPYTTLFRSRERRDPQGRLGRLDLRLPRRRGRGGDHHQARPRRRPPLRVRSEEHTSELQSRRDLVCRLLLEKKNNKPIFNEISHLILSLLQS